ncbi:MAG: helix-turn-helix domain-containing protein [Lachnospiraceae bacterium]
MPNFLKVPLELRVGDYRFIFLQFRHGRYKGIIPAHYHSNSGFEINYVIDGKGILKVQDTEYIMKPGMFYMIGPGVEHSQSAKYSGPLLDQNHSGEPGVEDYCIRMRIEKLDDNASNRENLLGDAFYNMQTFIAQDSDNLKILFDEIKKECAESEVLRDIILKGLFMKLLSKIVRYTAAVKDHMQMIPVNNDEYIQMKIESCFMYHVEDLTIEKLGEYLQYSTRQVQRILKLNYGKTFREMRNYYAITQAAELLKTTDKSVEELTTHFGYTTANQFKNCFKEQFGISPGEYRTQYRN